MAQQRWQRRQRQNNETNKIISAKSKNTWINFRTNIAYLQPELHGISMMVVSISLQSALPGELIIWDK